MAQLVERLLPTPEVHGLNPVIRQTFILDIYRQLCIEKTKIKKKRPGKAHFLNITTCHYSRLHFDVPRLLGDLLDFGQVFKAFVNN